MGWRRKLGNWGELVAATYLEAHGYTVLARQWRCERGEIDLVVRDGDEWVFVEVRTRRGESAGTPEASITPKKAQRLLQLAQEYLLAHQLEDVNWRIDLMAIQLDESGKLVRCDHLRHPILGW